MTERTDPKGATEPDRAVAVPASIQAAWGRHDRPARGPRPGLSLDRIVAAAIAVADAEGLDAVSMSRVAAELGASTMSLYRYVGAKDELLALMVDVAMGPPLSAPADGDWRPALEQWTWNALDAYLRSRWIVRVPIPGPPITPNQIRWMESGLNALRGTGLTAAEKLSTILLLSGMARAQATLAADIVDAMQASGGQDPSAGYGRALLELVDPATFPEVVAAVRSGELDEEDADFNRTELRFGLARVLDGLEVLIRQRGAASAG
jgi:AcrR family transcriptional regulator